MTSKDNQADRLLKSMPLTQRYALRKLSVGVASVLLGTSIAMGINGEIVHADTQKEAGQPVETADVPATMEKSITLPAVTTSPNTAEAMVDSAASADEAATANQLKATTPVSDAAYTVTNVKASSEPGDGTDHTGRTNLSFDINIDVANHDIDAGNYIDVSMGIPYKLTADGEEHVLAYGGGAKDTMPINLDYQTTTGGEHTAVIGYMRPVSPAERSYATSYHQSPAADVDNVTWRKENNDNSLGKNGNGGSNDSYQIVFNDQLAKIKKDYGDNNLSLARMHFNLTWHNITGFDLDEAPLDTRYYHLYSTNSASDTTLVPQNDIKIGGQTFTSGFSISVKGKVHDADNFNKTVIPVSSAKYAAHTWYYDQKTKQWGIGTEVVRFPDQFEAVELAPQNDQGVKLGQDFTITVTKPAENKYVSYNFIDDDALKADLMKAIVVNHHNYDLDPVDGADDVYVTRTMIASTIPDITVTSADSNDGLTRTYHVKINGNYLGFKKDKAISLINWRAIDLQGMLPPENLTNPQDDTSSQTGYYDGVTLRDSELQAFLEKNPWKLQVTNSEKQDLYNSPAGYYVQPYVYRDDVTANNGILTGTINDIENAQVTETIHYLYKGGQKDGQEAAPTYSAKLGFAHLNVDGTWQDWTPASDTFAAVDAPTVVGYHAVDDSDKAVKAVDAINVSHDTDDIDITIYYVADPQRLTYTVIDDDKGQALESDVDLADGLSDEPLPADTDAKYQKIINSYLDQGYYLVSKDQLPANFDDDTAVDQNVVAHLKKKNTLKTKDHQVTRTITYYDQTTGKQIVIDGVTDPVKQTVSFERHAVISGADGKTVLGYNTDGKQDEKGNYLVEITTDQADSAWQKNSGKWAKSTNPDLAKYGYDSAKDSQDKDYPAVAAETPTVATKDEAIKVYYPEKVVTSPETTQVTRTIHYTYGNGPHKGETAAPDAVQTVDFSREKKVNQVTKETSFTAWQATPAAKLPAVPSPAIDYYTPSDKQVKAVAVKAGDKDTTVDVVYTTEPNKVTYTVIDDTTGKTLVDHQELTNGFADEQLPTTATSDYQAAAKHYQDLGYTIVSQDNLPAAFTHEDQNVTIHLLMKNSLQTERQTTTRTITYYDKDTGKQIMIDGVTEPVMQRAIFQRQAVISGPNNAVQGYNLDGQRDKNGNYLVEVPVSDADSAWRLASGGWPAAMNPDLAYYGYQPAETVDGDAFPVVEAGQPTALTPNESVKVYYQARVTPGEETATATRTIHYVYANGPKQGKTAAPDATQTVTFTRTTATNEVTKDVQFGDWQASSSVSVIDGQKSENENKDEFAAVDSPVITDYTPDQATVAAVVANRNSDPLNVTVNYTTQPHQITYTVIDDVTGLKLVNDYFLTKGFPTENVPVDARTSYEEVASHYVDRGYQLVSADQLPAVFADHDENMVIHLTHATKSVTEKRNVNEDVKYQFVNGAAAAPTYQATPIEFTRTGTVDQVTNRTVWQAWTPSTASFAAVVSPEISGYETNTPQIDEQFVNESSQDLHFIVLYSKTPTKPHTTPEEPEQPVTPAPPASSENSASNTPATSSSSATSTPAKSTEPTSSTSATPEIPVVPPTSSASSAAEQSTTPTSDVPASSAPDTPASTTPDSSAPASTPASVTPESSAPASTPASVTPDSSAPASAPASTTDQPAMSSATPAQSTAEVTTAEPARQVQAVATHAAGAETAAKASAKKTLPKTGNQHRSIGLFGIVLGKKGKKQN